MAIQYLLVTFTEERSVLADGAGVGFTNHILMLPSDEYEITLGGSGYTPASQSVALTGTSIVKPMVIAFAPVAAMRIVAAATAEAQPALAKRAKKGKRNA
ncbi:MAG: PEGA domain-containing protein [Burkholderiales bacterium]|nr:PEGA domain-containing protein [Burkholderiales bacterium]